MATKKYLSLEKLIEYDTLLKEKINIDINAVLPSVNTSDNGKFLRVSSGKWTVVDVLNAEGVEF